MKKIDQLKVLVVDTNILVNGIVLRENLSYQIIDLLRSYKVKLGTTTPIIREYERVFQRNETANKVMITDEHRSELKQLLRQSHPLHSERPCEGLSEHYHDLYTKDLLPDYKLIIAASLAANETDKPGVLVSNDRALVDKWLELSQIRILAMTAYDFVSTFT